MTSPLHSSVTCRPSHAARVYHGGITGMSYTMTARNKASLDKLSLSARFDGSMDLMGLATVSLGSGSIRFKDDVASSIKSKASQFRTMLVPSGVRLPMYQTNDGSAWIDCPEWTALIQAAYDAKGEGLGPVNTLKSLTPPADWPLDVNGRPFFSGWQAPIDYKLSTIASLFAVPKLFPAALRSMLPRAQQALEAFIAGCGYMDSSLPDSAAFLNGRPSACPPLPKGDCVQGTACASR